MSGLHWPDVWVLYRRELRSAFRERNIVVNSVVIPIFLYPLLLWVMFTGMSFVEGQTEGMVSRVAVGGDLETPLPLEKALTDDPDIELVPGAHHSREATARIRSGDLDALLVLEPLPSGRRADGSFAARLYYDASEDRSDKARQRVREVVDAYRKQWLDDQARERGIAPPAWRQFTVESDNLASGREMGAFVLALLVPILLVVMVALGCLYPAVDSTAGERERKTWETLLSVAASRPSILTAKYLYVATLGSLAGLLNVAAMVVSVRAILAPLLAGEEADLEFRLPLAALPVLAAGALLLALFVAAGMMLLASFAQTFKEGQSLVSPFYFVMVLPVLFLSSPDLQLTPALAAVPVANVTLMLREAIAGVYQWPLILLTIVVELATVIACLAAAAWALRLEEVLVGSHEGSAWRLLVDRLPWRRD